MRKESVKGLEGPLRPAYRAGDANLVKPVTALVRLSRKESARVIANDLGCSVASIYAWQKNLVYEGRLGLKVSWRGGRPSKLSKRQKGRLCELISAGPLAAGFASACWNTALLQQLIDDEFGVFYTVHYLAELLGNLGF